MDVFPFLVLQYNKKRNICPPIAGDMMDNIPLITLFDQSATNRMTTKRKILQRILAGSKNIRFSDMVGLAKGFGFRLSRTEGSHHIFVHPDIPELLNLQEVKGQAKPYQMRQFLKLVERYSLKLKEERWETTI